MKDYSELKELLSTGPRTPREIQDELELDAFEIGNLTQRAVVMNKGVILRANPPKSILMLNGWHKECEDKDLWTNGKIQKSIGFAAFMREPDDRLSYPPHVLLTFLLVLIDKAIENWPNEKGQEELIEVVTDILHKRFLDKYDTRTVEDIL